MKYMVKREYTTAWSQWRDLSIQTTSQSRTAEEHLFFSEELQLAMVLRTLLQNAKEEIRQKGVCAVVVSKLEKSQLLRAYNTLIENTQLLINGRIQKKTAWRKIVKQDMLHALMLWRGAVKAAHTIARGALR